MAWVLASKQAADAAHTGEASVATPDAGGGRARRCLPVPAVRNNFTNVQSSFAPNALIGATGNWSMDRVHLLARTGDGVYVRVDAHAVARILGLQEGGIHIPLGRPSGKAAILSRVHALLDTSVPRSNNVPVSRVLAILEGAMNGEMDAAREKKLLAAYSLFAGAVFLAPQTATPRVRDELLPVVEDPRRISQFDICGLVVDVLRKGALAARDVLPLEPNKMILPGCLLVPLILLMDAKEHGVEALDALQSPRIAEYSKSTMQEMMKKHFPPKLFINKAIRFVDADGADPTPVVVNPTVAVGLETPAITRAAVAALSLSLERSKLGDAKDLECWQESMRIIELEKNKKTIQIMKLGCDRKQAEMKDMLDKFVAEVMQLLSYGHGTDASDWSQRSTNRFMSLPEGDQGREALVALARDAASAIQMTAMDRVKVSPDVDGVVSSTPMGVDVENHIPDLNESSSSTDDTSGDIDEHISDFYGDTTRYEISSDDEPPRQIRRHSINTPRHNTAIPAPIFDNSAPHENGAAPVVPAPAVPADLAPFVIDNGPFGLSPFQLGVSHAEPPIHWISFNENVVRCRNDELYMDWFVHGMPWELTISGARLVQSFREDGEMTYYTVDAAVHMFNEKEMAMMAGTGYDMWRCMVLANFLVQFLSTPGDYDLDAAVNMFMPDRLGFSPSKCLMIMAPVILEDSRAWCVYAFDMHAKILNILDPGHTLQDQEVMAGLHATNAELLLSGLGEVGLVLDDGFTINREEWGIEYNIGLNNPCSLNDSGVYLFHYARNFTGANLSEQIDEDGLVVLRKKLFYEIISMRGNTREKPGFMERDD
ncbi:hypothetical protein D1007_42521 [Hordeum vulgare]|nr:hypothetical protein D1007_42521 [Hordeum vulgare]